MKAGAVGLISPPSDTMASSASAADNLIYTCSCHGLPAEERQKAIIAFNRIQKFIRNELADIHPHVEFTFKMDYRFADAPPCRCEVCDRELVGYAPHKGAEDTLCFACGEVVDDVEGDFPELAAENFTSKEARFAAIARQEAETCAEAAEDTDNANEIAQCLKKRTHMLKRAAHFDAIVAPASASSSLAAAPKRPDYNHHYWPSPRAKMFANELIDGPKLTKHKHALIYLAARADITVEQLLEMSPRTYADKHTGSRMPAFLKKSS